MAETKGKENRGKDGKVTLKMSCRHGCING